MKRTFVGSLVLVAAFLTGCTQSYYTGMQPQSHFDFPNSNVVPMGRASGSASVSSIFGTPYVTSDMMEEAVQDALRKVPGSDILIDYQTFQETSSFLIVSTLTYRVEGTAAKMEIGEQKLR